MRTVNDRGNPNPVALEQKTVRGHEEERKLCKQLRPNEGLQPSWLQNEKLVVICPDIPGKQLLQGLRIVFTKKDLQVHKDGNGYVCDKVHKEYNAEERVHGFRRSLIKIKCGFKVTLLAQLSSMKRFI